VAATDSSGGSHSANMSCMARLDRNRTVIGVLALSTAINMLDRQVLAALAPTVKQELHMSGTEFGFLISAFTLAYAVCAPLAGWFIDSYGLSAGIKAAVAIWSVASMASGFSRSLGGLLGWRAVLGAGESAGMPALAKANALHLRPNEFGLSLAVNSIGVTLGAAAAPLLVAAVLPRFGWRAVFLLTGALGLLWIPLWNLISPKSVVRSSGQGKQAIFPGRWKAERRGLLRDRRLWKLTASNALIMTGYTVWTNWTTVYFVQQLHLPEGDANRHYAWIPPVFATIGGFYGGWLSYRWIRRGMDAPSARLRGCMIAALCLLMTAGLPLYRSPVWAAAIISSAMFWTMSLQMNTHILPLDLFGPKHAGLSVSVLACSYGLMQMLVSPVIGAVVDRVGFAPLCVTLPLLPLAGVWLMKASLSAPYVSDKIARPEHAEV
jgi:ACS family hexuronate transporter-like MFS transporter